MGGAWTVDSAWTVDVGIGPRERRGYRWVTGTTTGGGGGLVGGVGSGIGAGSAVTLGRFGEEQHVRESRADAENGWVAVLVRWVGTKQ